MSSPDNEIIKKLVEKAGEMDPNLAHIKPKIQTPSNGKLVLIYEKKVLTEDGMGVKYIPA